MSSKLSLSVVLCHCDGLPCDRVIGDLGFGSCYVKRSDGTLSFICPRLVLKSDVFYVEELVHKELLPK